MPANPKEVAAKIMGEANAMRIRFPKTWDEAQIRQCVGAQLMTNRGELPGTFNEKGVIDYLIDKFGIDEVDDSKSSKAGGAKTKKRAADSEDIGDDDQQGEKTKKTKKIAVIACEDNRNIADAIKEMGDIYFKNSDPRKGGVFSKAAKAIREAEFAITNKKEAKSLKGVGDGIAGYIDEYLSSGVISKLEDLRAGTA